MKCSAIGCTEEVPDKQPTLQMVGGQDIFLCAQHKHEALQSNKPLKVEGRRP